MNRMLHVSVIVPTLNEADSLPRLLPRIAQSLGERPYEVLVVDDNSRDGTPVVCADLARQYPLRLLVRQRPENGLSGAVLHGAAATRGEYLVVMDADLQHPPERLPDLLRPLESGEADFVLGSRYVHGASTEEEWGRLRRWNSLVATALARPLVGGVRDPMSGFFALRRSTYSQASRLSPTGYKIALELMCKCPVNRIREVPIHFGLRAAGTSKLSCRQQFRYLRHLARLYDHRFPRLSCMSRLGATFAGVLLAGTVLRRLRPRAHARPRSGPSLDYMISRRSTSST